MGLKKLSGLLLCFLLVLPFVIADHIQSHDDSTLTYGADVGDDKKEVTLPIGLQRIQEYNEQQAEFYAKNISLFIAFLAGLLSFLAPCTIAILPAFFAYTFKEKKKITQMTFIFFIGFSIIFVLFGILAALLGTSLTTIVQDNSTIIFFAGILLIALGVMSFFGKGFSSFIKIKKKPKNDALGTFLFGILFALGWSACLGPILVGILLVASTFGSYIHAGFLLFFYSLGIFIPLFIFSFIYDKYDLSKTKFIQGKMWNIGPYTIHSTNAISGILLILLGLLFVFYRSTSKLYSLPILNRGTILSSNIQSGILSIPFVNLISILVFLVFIYFLILYLKPGKKKR